ncbi:hypothetical protein C8N42_1134 [Celeribacter persicus]|uniref:Uncharacterized protein n=1 Tax=Celeribacter persicus TaxID=1651082 RepID=A0A2T5HBB5_9RHOB|nr:hypothetical protein C8N42_1134 [Celeribacter persicus]
MKPFEFSQAARSPAQGMAILPLNEALYECQIRVTSKRRAKLTRSPAHGAELASAWRPAAFAPRTGHRSTEFQSKETSHGHS